MKTITTDGNGASVTIAYALSELAFIYPITPSSPMSEQYDEWSAQGKLNLFGQIPQAVQMQSEGGVAGALHGGLSGGALSVSFTCSQGLLLMIPELYKLAGELLPAVLHVPSRALSTHALSIFGDHQDIMACRQTGCALLCSGSVQESMDFALVAHLAAWKGFLPFLHFFDGFRTSHELTKINAFEREELSSLIDDDAIERFRRRALTPSAPIARGSAQNPDVYFQNRERANPHYLALPQIVQGVMDDIAKLSGRHYHLFDYFGDKNATSVLVIMGSGSSTAEEVVEELLSREEKVGLIKVRLYRPFDADRFFETLPKSVKIVTVLDRTKEAGALGEPLYLDVCAALQEKSATHVCVYGGRYGLGGKEFTPAHVYAVFKNAQMPTPKNHFTVGIQDDVTNLSLPIEDFSLPSPATACLFYGLGSDGTVGANKNSIRILGEHTSLYVQGFFCYDSRKSGGVTISHLRFGSTPIRSAYLIDQADFIACHNPSYLARYDMLSHLKEGGTFLLNCPWTELPALEEHLPAPVKRALVQKRAKLYVIDGTAIAKQAGLDTRVSTVMQAAFFFLQQSLLPYEKAKALLLEEIKRKFSKKGDTMVAMNSLCIEKAEEEIHEISYPSFWQNAKDAPLPSRADKGDYFENFIRHVLNLQGDCLPVSAFPPDGSIPTNTSRLEKHGAPAALPKWIKENCIQCNQCAFVCPHACIRPFLFEGENSLPTLPATGIANARYRIQVSPLDCMGCGVCARTCPAPQKALVMTPSPALLPQEEKAWELALSLPTVQSPLPRQSVKGSQFYQPLFEFSYACSGCGETPYIKLLTQLFGARLLLANATGCSSIYGASTHTCPYAIDKNGRGPAWISSLFEDNAELGVGLRCALEAGKDTEDKSVWILGGDGWAYDIGYGGLDHVLALGKKVRILVLDTEVYSNTGGQSSKATPLGAIARFAAKGKRSQKKDLGLMALSYQTVYVAQVSMGADKNQLIKAFTEAENYEGVSLVIVYSPCIEHGVYMGECMEEEKLVVESGSFLLYRYHPARGLTLDSKPPTKPLRAFWEKENRFARLQRENPALFEELLTQAEENNAKKRALFERLAESE